MFSQFFEPESVAIIGASKKPLKVGHELLKNIIDGNFPGKIYPINPAADEILGLKCYPSILDVKEPVDLAVVVVPAQAVPEAIKQCGEKGTKAVVVISAGFSEIGNKTLEEEVVRIARQYGVRIIGPNCTGIINTHRNLYATMESRAGRGDIAFVTQSGALGGAVLAWAIEKGIGLSKFASYGNACDVDESDLLNYLADDPQTKVITLYIEGVKNGRKFFEAAKNVTRKKPLIAIKGGLSKAGARSVASHTGSLAGNEAIYRTVFKQSGIIEADGIEEMFDMARALAYLEPMKGDKVAILTNSGGPAVLATDALERLGLKVPEPPEKIVRALDFLPPVCSRKNPIDLTAEGSPEAYVKAFRALFSEEYYDAGLIIDVPIAWDAQGATEAAKLLTEAIREVGKPTVVCWMSGHLVRDAVAVFEENKIPNYETPKRAAKALWALYSFKRVTSP
jgi:acetyl coenzyme A synthetase (ADP forming)-like protein